MIITSFDKNHWYRLDIAKCKWSENLEDVIEFELNNLSEETKYPIPDETSFIMSIEDAKQLYAWLGSVLK